MGLCYKFTIKPMITLESIVELDAKLKTTMAAVSTPGDLELLRRDWLGKEGTLKRLFKELQGASSDERPKIAAAVNALKSKIESFCEERTAKFAHAERARKLEAEHIDLSLPGRASGLGQIHPISKIERRITSILRPFGFEIVYGPEIESEYYCFDALNIAPHHPARDMQDTFYTSTGHVLRTHTTSMQARTLQKGGLPIKALVFGRAYRNETEDASHQAMFHQFEMFWLDKGLTTAHLMGIIQYILMELYGQRVKVRFVPKFYPYTEPSLGPQIECGICRGAGCPACGGAGWVTVGGSGMIHRNVLKEFGYTPGEVAGLAFGLGTSRLAQQEFSLPKMKTVYENDLRVLRALR